MNRHVQGPKQRVGGPAKFQKMKRNTAKKGKTAKGTPLSKAAANKPPASADANVTPSLGYF